MHSSDWRSFFDQSAALTWANLKCRYRKTAAGFLWVVLNPLITFSVQAVAFGHFLKVDVENYLLFLVSGLLPWMFIAQTLEMSAGVFVNAGGLIKSVPVSPLVFLLAQVLDNLVNFIAAFILLLAIGVAFEGGAGWHWGLIALASIPLVGGVFAMSQWLATAQVFFRDTRFIVSFALQACFFLTPVFYPREMVPEAFRWLIEINPFFRLISPFQILIHDFDLSAFIGALVWSSLTAGALMMLAAFTWRRRKHLVYHYV
jgi:ABC-type polysaccharide/polyol phosphate export permease